MVCAGEGDGQVFKNVPILEMKFLSVFFLWGVMAERSCALDKFWCCLNVGSNPGLAGRDACVLEQDT